MRPVKFPVLVVTIQKIEGPDEIVRRLFMGIIEPDMMMLGEEDAIDLYKIDEYLISSIEDALTGKYTHPAATISDQVMAVSILRGISDRMTADV